jgi:tetratricopeptide (TPR) repeat protein
MQNRDLEPMFAAGQVREMLPHERIVYFALHAKAALAQGKAGAEAVFRHGLGAAYHAEQRHYEAIESWLDSLRLFESLDDTQGRARVLDDLGIISIDQADFARAQNYFLQGLRLANDAGLADVNDMITSHLLAMLD